MGRGPRGGYLVHLDGHDAAGLHGTFGAHAARAADVAADVGAPDVRDGVVGQGETGALGAVVCVSLRDCVKFPAGRLIMSTPSTQSCWKVACEAAWWAAPKSAK